jgi:hypothetical protein
MSTVVAAIAARCSLPARLPFRRTSIVMAATTAPAVKRAPKRQAT